MMRLVPWWFKIIVKLILSRFPLGYPTWRRLNLFLHGNMTDPQYAQGIFLRHTRNAQIDPAGKTILEIGPGDSLFTALVAKAYGASRVHLIDDGRFAIRDLQRYRTMIAHLRRDALSLSSTLDETTNLEELLHASNAAYSTQGLRSLKELPSQSVDFIFSHAVLEHVSVRELPELIKETARVLKPGGACSHTIDLADHLGGALNNLRFSTRFWESAFMREAGFTQIDSGCQTISRRSKTPASTRLSRGRKHGRRYRPRAHEWHPNSSNTPSRIY